MKKILLKNGIVVSGKKCFVGDVLIEGEKIKKVGKNIKVTGSLCEVVDCTGKYIFPGFIDGHTHFDLSVAGTTTIDDFKSGTKAAISGGTTTIIDYGTQYKGETLKQGLKNWLNKAKDGVSCDFGVHMSISDWNPRVKNEVKDMVKAGVTSFKLYTTYDIKLDDDDMLAALTEIAKCKGITGVHCENDGIIKDLRSEVKGTDNKKVISHALTRPSVAEADCVNRLSYMSHITGAAFLAVHVTCEEALNEVKLAKKKGYKVYGETCPQYLFFDDSVYKKKFDEASKYVCAPPIRKKKDVNALWKALNDGSIDIVSTDHCSFTKKQKALGKNDFRKIPGGLNGVEQRGILLFDAVQKKKISIERMCELLSENPAKLFGLWDRKGFVKKGYDADLVIIDPKKTTTLSLKNQVSKSDYCAFEGKKLKGKIERVFLRGRQVVDQNKNITDGIGKYIKRKVYKDIN
ncbi:MAG: dihydropyrimidinase [Lachnospiraceae bacterium]|nr:dihydropyrimidinase [Lachnospiraceae bacterium]